MKIFHESSSNKMTCKTNIWDKKPHIFHWHEKIEVVKCIEGSFGALIDGKNYKIEKDDILVIGESVIHKFDFSFDNAKTIILQFPYKLLLNFGIIPEEIEPLIKREKLTEIQNLQHQIDSIFDIIGEEKIVKSDENDTFFECICSALYYKLMEHFPLKANNKSLKKDRQEFYKIVKYVNENFTDNITVASIAEEFFSDRNKISKLFLKYSGVTLNHYINSLRMNMALKLIDSGAKVTEAALESGFQTVRTFNNIRNKMKES